MPLSRFMSGAKTACADINADQLKGCLRGDNPYYTLCWCDPRWSASLKISAFK